MGNSMVFNMKYLCIIFFSLFQLCSYDNQNFSSKLCELENSENPTVADSLFLLAFENMKLYYDSLQNTPTKLENRYSPEFMNEFDKILAVNSHHIPTLMNAFYFSLVYRDSRIHQSHKYLKRLIEVDNKNPLIALLKFSEYEKLSFLSADMLGEEHCEIDKEALDSLSYYANYLYKNYNTYYIKMAVIPYANFDSFEERENALINSVAYIESNDNRNNLQNSLGYFIEKYASEVQYFVSLTYLRDYQIFFRLKNFYYIFLNKRSMLKYLEDRCGIKYDSNEEIIPNINSYPQKYRARLLEKYGNLNKQRPNNIF